MKGTPLTLDEYLDILSAMPNADREEVGALDIYTGRHQEHGQIMLAVANGQDVMMFAN